MNTVVLIQFLRLMTPLTN